LNARLSTKFLDSRSIRNYIVSMKAQIVRIGNSQGIRIPKPFLQQSGIAKEVDIEVQGNKIVLRSLRRPREGWEESFRQMASKGDDRLLDEKLLKPTRWDEEEWQW
jgi:antitoxin MazE